MFINVSNELGTIVFFSQHCEKNGYEIVSIRSKYPDAVIYSKEMGMELVVEFEYKSSSFWLHNHDVRECDAVICWIHDTEICVPVLELSTGGWGMSDLAKDEQKEIEYLKKRVVFLEGLLKPDDFTETRQEYHQNTFRPEGIIHSKTRIGKMVRNKNIATNALKCATGRISYREAAKGTSLTHTTFANYTRDLKTIYTDSELENLYISVVVKEIGLDEVFRTPCFKERPRR
jgi:hypothetical protein